MKTCRFCLQEVDDYARRCSHCQADISLFGRLRVVQTIVTGVIAIGGVAFGFYEKHIAKTATQELKHEQQALTQVLDSVPENEIAEKYKTGQNENELKAELKKNPKNIDARIRLRWLQRHRSRNGKGQGRPKGVAKKPGRKVSQQNSRPKPPSNATARRPDHPNAANRSRRRGRSRGRVVPASAVRNDNSGGRGEGR